MALKQLRRRYADESQARSRLLFEAEVTAGLEHPGVVPVYGLGQYADGRPFFTMRLTRGDYLDSAIKHFHWTDRPGGWSSGLHSRIDLHLLPKYSPDCNPIERVWWNLHESPEYLNVLILPPRWYGRRELSPIFAETRSKTRRNGPPEKRHEFVSDLGSESRQSIMKFLGIFSCYAPCSGVRLLKKWVLAVTLISISMNDLISSRWARGVPQPTRTP